MSWISDSSAYVILQQRDIAKTLLKNIGYVENVTVQTLQSFKSSISNNTPTSSAKKHTNIVKSSAANESIEKSAKKRKEPKDKIEKSEPKAKVKKLFTEDNFWEET